MKNKKPKGPHKEDRYNKAGIEKLAGNMARLFLIHSGDMKHSDMDTAHTGDSDESSE